ncbi:Uncharacterised protein [Chryseobacterium nakagawai]|uniref:Uncharacterized protein n=1 Tax=Chryseobacterium nakagawai TaxID=1241982 RepID=A0AAD0YMH2_CHRNA|nr:hypothetical protein [Chryseobacterium nakagawai]AZA91153.1 hypothetical protein EG343_11180 [Chryseobacterium nakagawai]VEH22713.1 Uncharacterised protein [Chryseobacterium nakagawai]
MNYASIFETITVFLGAVLLLVIPILFLHRKHKNCGGWSFPSGVGGSEYTQYKCKKCKEVYWRKNKLSLK